MKRLPAFLLACVIPVLGRASDRVVVLEDFESFSAGDVPSRGWRTREGSAKSTYAIEEENRDRFLHAKYDGKSIQFFKEKKWKVSSHPWFSWKWRVREFPIGSDERRGPRNDSAAAVYVLFPGKWFIPRTIKYVWSHSVPEGTVIRRDRRFPMIVVRSGEAKKGEWVLEKRNILDDFKKLFGDEFDSPQNPEAIGFLTDANAVKGKAEADYDQLIAVSDPAWIPLKTSPTPGPVLGPAPSPKR